MKTLAILFALGACVLLLAEAIGADPQMFLVGLLIGMTGGCHG